MLPEWRLLIDGVHEARRHFAVEEALARLLDEGHSPPTLRLRRVYPAVFVGVNQNTWTEVNVLYCQANGIQIVRRMNGGGAVYHEMGSFCFSAFFQRDFLAQTDEECYRLFAIPIIRTCADYGVAAQFGGRNDVLVGNRKIYGSAQFSWYRAFVQSGTFLINMNFEAMQQALTPPAIKFSNKPVQSVRERVTSLSQEVGRELDPQEVMERFSQHAADVLGIRLVPGELSEAEETLAAELLAVKYGTDKWNFGSPLECQITVADRSDEGVLSLSADIEDNRIKNARITGDILFSQREDLDSLEQSLAGCTIEEAITTVKAALLSTSIRETLIRLLEKLGQELFEISSKRQKEIET